MAYEKKTASKIVQVDVSPFVNVSCVCAHDFRSEKKLSKPSSTGLGFTFPSSTRKIFRKVH